MAQPAVPIRIVAATIAQPQTPADETRARQAEAPRQLAGFGYADSQAAHDLDRRRPCVGAAQFEWRVIERQPIMRVVDAKRLTDAAGARTQQPNVVQAATAAHGVESVGRFDGADQHAGTVAGLAADGIQAPVNAVRAVDISVPGRAEHRRIARPWATMAVRGGIVDVVGLGLDDAATDAVDQQQHADQPPCHIQRGIVEIQRGDAAHGCRSGCRVAETIEPEYAPAGRLELSPRAGAIAATVRSRCWSLPQSDRCRHGHSWIWLASKVLRSEAQ